MASFGLGTTNWAHHHAAQVLHHNFSSSLTRLNECLEVEGVSGVAWWVDTTGRNVSLGKIYQMRSENKSMHCEKSGARNDAGYDDVSMCQH